MVWGSSPRTGLQQRGGDAVGPWRRWARLDDHRLLLSDDAGTTDRGDDDVVLSRGREAGLRLRLRLRRLPWTTRDGASREANNITIGCFGDLVMFRPRRSILHYPAGLWLSRSGVETRISPARGHNGINESGGGESSCASHLMLDVWRTSGNEDQPLRRARAGAQLEHPCTPILLDGDVTA